MSPSVAKEDTGTLGRVRAVFGVLLGVGIWVTTWVLPLTFMIVMAWGCETHARQLGRRTLLYYDGEAGKRPRRDQGCRRKDHHVVQPGCKFVFQENGRNTDSNAAKRRAVQLQGHTYFVNRGCVIDQAELAAKAGILHDLKLGR